MDAWVTAREKERDGTGQEGPRTWKARQARDNGTREWQVVQCLCSDFNG